MADFFTVLRHAKDDAPRLGRLQIDGRQAINTPHYLANTSRGVVPHLTQDTLSRSTNISGLYASLEDFIERAPRVPIYEYGIENPAHSLRQFLAVPQDKLLVLGTRRTPPIIPPPATSNTNTAIAVSTSVGIRFLEADEFAHRIETLGADIVVGLADVPFGRALVPKRIEKATDRSIEWIANHMSHRLTKNPKSKYFASLLPVTCANQQYYIDDLVDRHLNSIHGLTVYSLDTLEDLPVQLSAMPKLGLTEAATPLDAIRHIQHGLDVLVLPFVDMATDAGLAFAFKFPQSASVGVAPLVEDMWDVAHAVDLGPLLIDCSCYTCTNHHRAYVQHLLSAKEMLGWVLIQIHNYHIMSSFFEAIRISIAAGTFSRDVEAFSLAFEPTFPEKTGQGPRVRGYQRRSERAHEPKQNLPAYKRYKDETVASRESSKAISGLPEDFDLDLLAMH